MNSTQGKIFHTINFYFRLFAVEFVKVCLCLCLARQLHFARVSAQASERNTNRFIDAVMRRSLSWEMEPMCEFVRFDNVTHIFGIVICFAFSRCSPKKQNFFPCCDHSTVNTTKQTNQIRSHTPTPFIRSRSKMLPCIFHELQTVC